MWLVQHCQAAKVWIREEVEGADCRVYPQGAAHWAGISSDEGEQPRWLSHTIIIVYVLEHPIACTTN